GGIALYLFAHVALRLRMNGGLGLGRPLAMVFLLALLPVAREVPALASLGLVAAVCVTLILYEVMRHRESRAFIRAHRADLSIDEFREVETHAVAVTAGDGTSRSWRWWRPWSRTA